MVALMESWVLFDLNVVGVATAQQPIESASKLSIDLRDTLYPSNHISIFKFVMSDVFMIL